MWGAQSLIASCADPQTRYLDALRRSEEEYVALKDKIKAEKEERKKASLEQRREIDEFSSMCHP